MSAAKGENKPLVGDRSDVATHKVSARAKHVTEFSHFSKQTLYRHLETLIEKGLVEKEIIRSGRRGRPMGKYRLIGKYWEPNSLIGFPVPYMGRDGEGRLLLVRKVRDHHRKNHQRTVILGDFFEKYLGIVDSKPKDIETEVACKDSCASAITSSS